jgi:hydroxymethylpyrimidine/phosphomethylpyrimidine kinase
MLATAAIVEAVAAAIKALELPQVVVDPVMVSKSGAYLLDDDASVCCGRNCCVLGRRDAEHPRG